LESELLVGLQLALGVGLAPSEVGFLLRGSLGFWDIFLFSVRLQSLYYLGLINFSDALGTFLDYDSKIPWY